MITFLFAIVLVAFLSGCCLRYSDLTPGATYNVGDMITTSGTNIMVEQFQWANGNWTSSGSAKVDTRNYAQGSGKDLNAIFLIQEPCSRGPEFINNMNYWKYRMSVDHSWTSISHNFFYFFTPWSIIAVYIAIRAGWFLTAKRAFIKFWGAVCCKPGTVRAQAGIWSMMTSAVETYHGSYS